MKKDIKFECDVCGQKQVVEVSVLHDGGTLQIMMDRFFIMDVVFRNGECYVTIRAGWQPTNLLLCFDGLEEHEVNINQGAESIISYLMARLKMEDYMNEPVR